MTQPIGLAIGTRKRQIDRAVDTHDKRSHLIAAQFRDRTALLCREMYGSPLPPAIQRTTRQARAVGELPLFRGIAA